MLLSNVSRGNVLVVALKMMIISSVASLNCLLMQFVIHKNVNDGLHYVSRDVMKFETINYIVTVFNIVAGIFLLILFIVWFFRAYTNMQSLDYRLSDSRYWIILGWLVPLLNLIMPYRLLNKMTLSALAYLQKHKGLRLKRYKPFWLLIIWTSFIMVYILRTYRNRELINADALYIVMLGIVIHVIVLGATILLTSFIAFYRKVEALIYKVDHENNAKASDCIELVRE